MSIPYFPMYPTDFEADTSHLTLEEDGAYNRMLRLMWLTPNCSLPNDPKWIMRRMRINQQIYDDVVSVIIDEFMTISKGRIINKRLMEEYHKTSVAHGKRVVAGRKGGNANALRTKKKASSNAEAMRKQPEPEPEPEPEPDITLISVREDDLYQALGHHRENGASYPSLMVLSSPINWIQNGCDMDLDILPTVKALSSKANRITTWAYFSNAVFEARDKRLSPAPEPIVNGTGNINGGFKTKSDRNQESVDKARAWFNEMQENPPTPKMKEIN